jgi:hypothetical protein
MSTVSDYLSGGKKPFTMGGSNNASVVTRNEVEANKFGNKNRLNNFLFDYLIFLRFSLCK